MSTLRRNKRHLITNQFKTITGMQVYNNHIQLFSIFSSVLLCCLVILSLEASVYNSRVLLLNVRRNFSSDQKIFERLVLPEGDNWRFRIYLAESDALSLFFFSFGVP